MTAQDVIRLAAQAGAEAALKLLEQKSDGAIQKAIDELVRKAVSAGVEAVEAVKTEERGRLRDSRLANTRLLLKNYRRLKLHFEEAVFDFDAEHAEDAPGAIWRILSTHFSGESAFIDSIWRSATKTATIIAHIDRMLAIYRKSCEGRESDMRAWRTLEARYLSEVPRSLDQIAEDEHVSRRTSERDLEAAVQAVGSLLFGVDGIR